MEMSKAAIAPRQPNITDTDRAHPLFPHYSAYRSSMSRQLVEAGSFAAWLAARDREEADQKEISRPEYREFLGWMQANKGGARRCPAGNSFPANFHFWLSGGRW